MDKKKEKIIVFTGAGVSADSGIATFRDKDGLWDNYRIEDICTPEALLRNREKVINFYNIQRKSMFSKEPNAGHYALVELEKKFEVKIITQNVDDLHERAGSKSVLHLHGELRKLRSSISETDIVNLEGWEQALDSRHPDGSLLRPFIVFFGESVPMLEKAIEVIQEADILLIVGTSLAVYPAASLVHYVKQTIPVYVVDPGQPDLSGIRNKVIHIKHNSAKGLPLFVNQFSLEI